MEIIAIINILNFCWVNFIFKRPKIVFIKFSLSFSGEPIFHWVIEAFLVVTVNGISCDFGITFAV